MKKIIITGISSFTGMWFANALIKKNFKVYGTLTKRKHQYKNIVLKRIVNLNKKIKIFDKLDYNSTNLTKIIIKYKFEYFHYHGFYTKDYNNSNFKFYKANFINNYNIERIIKLLKENNCKRFIYTGSIFEKKEGIYNESNDAISYYGLSKSVTFSLIKLYCKKYKLPLMKIVIPNPFGEFENKKFNFYIVNKWKNNEIPKISFPNYIRDNIYIKDLIKYYILEICKNEFRSFIKIIPSGYSCSNEIFTNILKKNYEHIRNKKVNINIDKSAEYKMLIKRINGNDKLYKLKKNDWINYFQYLETL